MRFWLKWLSLTIFTSWLAARTNPLFVFYSIVQWGFYAYWFRRRLPQTTRFLVQFLVATVLGLWCFNFLSTVIFQQVSSFFFLAGMAGSLVQFTAHHLCHTALGMTSSL